MYILLPVSAWLTNFFVTLFVWRLYSCPVVVLIYKFVTWGLFLMVTFFLVSSRVFISIRKHYRLHALARHNTRQTLYNGCIITSHLLFIEICNFHERKFNGLVMHIILRSFLVRFLLLICLCEKVLFLNILKTVITMQNR